MQYTDIPPTIYIYAYIRSVHSVLSIFSIYFSVHICESQVFQCNVTLITECIAYQESEYSAISVNISEISLNSKLTTLCL